MPNKDENRFVWDPGDLEIGAVTEPPGTRKPPPPSPVPSQKR